LSQATFSFITAGCPSVRMEQLGCCWTDLWEILCLGVFCENVWRNFKLIKI